MKITIRKPIGYTQIGRKDQQEDAVWPPFDKVTADSRCIVLCDGVGGSAHGEIASQTTSKVIGGYLTSLIHKNGIVTDTDVQDAIKLAYDELEKIDTEGSVDGQPSMATTLTCVCIHDEGILAAHMGDSRIYLVRPGQGLLYQSSDHSLVNALLQAGELTLEEAKTFPRKNVITKAIQPHAQKRFNAEVHQLTDVRSGDYIFMCCDGVLEQLTNDRLVEILSMNCSDEKKLALLEAESTDRTKDNYTAYLIPIDKVEGESTIVNDDEVATVVVEQPQSQKPVTPPPYIPPVKKKNIDAKKILSIAMGVVALALIIFFVGRCSTDWFSKDNDTHQTTGEQDIKGLVTDGQEDTQKDAQEDNAVPDSEDMDNDVSNEVESDLNQENSEIVNQLQSNEDTDATADNDALSDIKEQLQKSKQKEQQ